MEMLTKGSPKFPLGCQILQRKEKDPSRLPLTEIVNGISKSAVVLFAGMVLWQ